MVALATTNPARAAVDWPTSRRTSASTHEIAGAAGELAEAAAALDELVRSFPSS